MAIPFEDSIIRTTASPKFTDDKFANVAARDAFSATLRYESMVVYCVAEKKNYQLQGGILNTNWVEFGGGTNVATYYDQVFTDADGIKTAWVLAAVPTDVLQAIVIVGGVPQEPSAYTLITTTGVTTLTLSEAPIAGVNPRVKYGVVAAAITDASITPAKLSALNFSYSSVATNFQQTVTGVYSVFTTGAVITTPTGRPIKIELVPDDGTANAYINQVTAGGTSYSNWSLTRNGTTIWKTQYGEQSTGATVTGSSLPMSLINFKDLSPPANTALTYQLVVESVSNATVRVINCKLKVEET